MNLRFALTFAGYSCFLCPIAWGSSFVVGGGTIVAAYDCPSGFAYHYSDQDGGYAECFLPTKKFDLKALSGRPIKVTLSRKGGVGIILRSVEPSEAAGTYHAGFTSNAVIGLGKAMGVQGTPNDAPSSVTSTQEDTPGNTCHPTIALKSVERQFDTACGPTCSQIRVYADVQEAQHSEEFRHISFQTVIDYGDGTSASETGSPNIGNDVPSGETGYMTRSNFDRPRMTVLQGSWHGDPFVRIRFLEVTCQEIIPHS